jgi:hypothetical protein
MKTFVYEDENGDTILIQSGQRYSVANLINKAKSEDVIEDKYYTPDHTFPDQNEYYYTVSADGEINKKVCVFDKEDLYNIAHSNYYARWHDAVRSRHQQTGIMKEVIRKIKDANKKERELNNG